MYNEFQIEIMYILYYDKLFLPQTSLTNSNEYKNFDKYFFLNHKSYTQNKIKILNRTVKQTHA